MPQMLRAIPIASSNSASQTVSAMGVIAYGKSACITGAICPLSGSRLANPYRASYACE